MATEVQAHERECAVCMNDFTTPKILPCGHLLCRQCVISWLDSKSDAECPLCTCPIVEHPRNSSRISADVVDALPTDYVMEEVVESASVLMMVNLCSVCEVITAEYLCLQCFERMCPSCLRIHKKMVATRSHHVESVSTVTPERLAASRPALCADHGDKPAEMFCAYHNLVICTLCGHSKHSECPDLKHLDVQMNSAGTALDSLTEELSKAEDNFKQAIHNLSVRVQKADVTEQNNLELVDKTFDRLQNIVEESRKHLKKVIRFYIYKFRRSLCDVKSEQKKRLEKVTSHKHLVTRAKTVRLRPTMIYAAQILTDRVNSLDLSVDLEAKPWVNTSPEIAEYCDYVVKQIKAELQSMHQEQTGFEAPVLVFDENCGINIRLTNHNRTAELVELYKVGNSVFFSRDAMVANVLYEVRIDKVVAGGSVLLGVMTIPPAQLTVPAFSDGLKDSVIRKYCAHGKSIAVGRHVGMLVDSSNNLHFYTDGHDQGVAAKDVGSPCFAVFDFRYSVAQVTALPTSVKA